MLEIYTKRDFMNSEPHHAVKSRNEWRLIEFGHRKHFVIGPRELSEDEIAELVQLIIEYLRSDKVQIRQYTAGTRINNEMTDRYRFDSPTLKELFTT